MALEGFARAQAVFSLIPPMLWHTLHFCEIQVLGGIRRFLFFSTHEPVIRWESHYLRTPFSSGNLRSWPSVSCNFLSPRELWGRVALIRQYLAWILISTVMFLLFYHPGSPVVFRFFWYLRSILVCEKGLFLIKVEYSLFFLNLIHDKYC